MVVLSIDDGSFNVVIVPSVVITSIMSCKLIYHCSGSLKTTTDRIGDSVVVDDDNDEDDENFA